LAGILGGAYNTSGPPVIIYGDSQRWPPAEFTANLQGFFLISSIAAVLSHAIASNITPAVLRTYVSVIPAILLGFWAGVSLAKALSPGRFRNLVFIFLIVIGLNLVIRTLAS
jgi:uncharacterized membrane protein YfcA